jgi:hypothetical protein
MKIFPFFIAISALTTVVTSIYLLYSVQYLEMNSTLLMQYLN